MREMSNRETEILFEHTRRRRSRLEDRSHTEARTTTEGMNLRTNGSSKGLSNEPKKNSEKNHSSDRYDDHSPQQASISSIDRYACLLDQK